MDGTQTRQQPASPRLGDTPSLRLFRPYSRHEYWRVCFIQCLGDHTVINAAQDYCDYAWPSADVCMTGSTPPTTMSHHEMNLSRWKTAMGTRCTSARLDSRPYVFFRCIRWLRLRPRRRRPEFEAGLVVDDALFSLKDLQSLDNGNGMTTSHTWRICIFARHSDDIAGDAKSRADRLGQRRALFQKPLRILPYLLNKRSEGANQGF